MISLWAIHEKADFLGKDNNAGKNRRQKENRKKYDQKKRTTYEMD